MIEQTWPNRGAAKRDNKGEDLIVIIGVWLMRAQIVDLIIELVSQKFKWLFSTIMHPL